jgi:hypothetical protein
LPDIVKGEIRRLNLVKESTSKEEIVIKNALQANVGGGTTRFRLYGYLVGEDAKDPFFKNMPIGDGDSFFYMMPIPDDEKTEKGDTFDSYDATKIELVIDTKDNSIVFSEIKRD